MYPPGGGFTAAVAAQSCPAARVGSRSHAVGSLDGGAGGMFPEAVKNGPGGGSDADWAPLLAGAAVSWAGPGGAMVVHGGTVPGAADSNPPSTLTGSPGAAGMSAEATTS